MWDEITNIINHGVTTSGYFKNLSQTSFGHISINSFTILTVLMAIESPKKRPFD